MPFWNPFRKPIVDLAACKTYEPLLRLASFARLELSESQPRNSDLVGELLAHLWRDDAIGLLLVRTALVRPTPNSYVTLENGKFASLHSDLLKIVAMPSAASTHSIEMHFIRELQAFTRKLTPQCPEDGEARYDALVVGLRACLRHNLQEVRQTDEIFALDFLFDGLKIADSLSARDALNDIYCEMLLITNQIIAAERDGPRISRLETLRRELHMSMLRSARTKPILWQMLKDPTTSEVFWPVVDMMRRHTCTDLVPKLLEILPFLSENGKVHVIKALDSIGDASVLPALQQLAQAKSLTVALPAAEAVRSFLRRSRSEAAQLLRATEAQSIANAGESLLRPAESGSSSVRSEELLRPE